MKKLFNFVLTLLISFNFIFGGFSSAVFARSTRRRGGKINARRNIGKRITKATGGEPVSRDINRQTQTEEKDPPPKKKAGDCSEAETKLTSTVDRFRLKKSEKVIFGQSVMLSNLLTPETYEVYNEKGSNTKCLKEYVCFGPYMSVMGRGGDNISKHVNDGIECFAYKPNSYYSFNIFNASDKDVSNALTNFNRGDLASGNNRVLYIDKKQSGTGQFQDFMHLQTQGYIDFTEHYNKIKEAIGNKEANNETGIFKACKKDLIEDSSYSFKNLYTLLVSAATAEGLATGLSAASMAMSAASSAKTGEITEDLQFLEKNKKEDSTSKITALRHLAKAKFVKMVATIANYLDKYGSSDLFDKTETYIKNSLNNATLENVINNLLKDEIKEPEEEVAGYNALQGDEYQGLLSMQNLLNDFKAKMNEIKNINVQELTDEKIDTLSESIEAFKGILENNELKTALDELKTALDELKTALNEFQNVINTFSDDEKKKWNNGESWDTESDSKYKNAKKANKKLREKLLKAQEKVNEVNTKSNTVEKNINQKLANAKKTVDNDPEIKEAHKKLENKQKLKTIIEQGKTALENITCDNCTEPTELDEKKEKKVIETLNDFIKDIDKKQSTFISGVSAVAACDNCSYKEIDKLISQYQNDVNNTDSANAKIEKKNKKIEHKHDNVKSMLDSTRSLDVGSAVTSAFATAGGAVGMGTSIAAAVYVKTTIERWKACKGELNNLQVKYNDYKAYAEEVFPGDTSNDKKNLDTVAPYTPAIEDILTKCNLPDAEKTLNKVRAETIGTSATASVGTATSLGATVASSIAASKARKTKGHLGDSPDYTEAKKEAEGLKASRTAAAVLSGIGTAAAGVATGLSAASSIKLEKLKDNAEQCKITLNNLQMKDLGNSQTNNKTDGEEKQQNGNNPQDSNKPDKNKKPGGISGDIHDATNGDKKEGDNSGSGAGDSGTSGNSGNNSGGNK